MSSIPFRASLSRGDSARRGDLLGHPGPARISGTEPVRIFGTRNGARALLGTLATTWKRIRLLWADGAYAGALVDWVRSLRRRSRIEIEIVKRSDDVKGFKVLPRRWVVERTFGWLGRQRRLSKDYEFRTDNSEATIHVAMIGLMLRRLATGAF
jgi:putative transposase